MTMKIILKEEVSGLGKAGEVKQVKDGYARNFLLPRGLALVATKHSLQQVELANKKRESVLAKEQKNAQELTEKLKGISLTLAVEANEEDKLYGSLIEHDIAQALAAEGIALDKKMIVLEDPIRALGIYDIPVKITADLTATVKVWVVRK